MTAGGVGIYAGPCNGDSTFSIPNVPPGNYQLAIFDTNLDIIFAQQGFTVDPSGGTCNGGAPCDFGDIPVFNWYSRLITGVFQDNDQDGFWDANEIGIGPESQSVNLRWRDGSIYQSFPTDPAGYRAVRRDVPVLQLAGGGGQLHQQEGDRRHVRSRRGRSRAA